MNTAFFLRRRLLLYSALLTLALVFVLTACGSNTNTGATGSSSPSSTSTPVGIYDTATGCPSNTVVTTAPARANVIVVPAQVNTTITAHNGDVIEIRLPFGHRWNGPGVSQGVLELQMPYGYASQSDGACIWRFVAKGIGTTKLNFSNQALCKKGQMCPMYIALFPFTIEVK